MTSRGSHGSSSFAFPELQSALNVQADKSPVTLPLLIAAAGISPWVTLLVVAGIATYTHRVPVAPVFEPFLGPLLLVVVAALLGLDAVAGKVPRLARTVEWSSVIAAAAVAALLWLALGRPATGIESAPAGVAAVVAAALQAGRVAIARRMDRTLLGMGHVVTSLAANVVAAGISAIALAVTVTR